MITLRYVYIIISGGEYLTGSTNDPLNVIQAIRKNNPEAKLHVVVAMGFNEAKKASRFLKRMKTKDFEYWARQTKAQQAQWISKAGGLPGALGNDCSEMFNNKI